MIMKSRKKRFYPNNRHAIKTMKSIYLFIGNFFVHVLRTDAERTHGMNRSRQRLEHCETLKSLK